MYIEDLPIFSNCFDYFMQYLKDSHIGSEDDIMIKVTDKLIIWYMSHKIEISYIIDGTKTISITLIREIPQDLNEGIICRHLVEFIDFGDMIGLKLTELEYTLSHKYKLLYDMFKYIHKLKNKRYESLETVDK